MAVEITHGKSIYTYRISAADPCVIEVRRNRKNGRWQRWGSRDSAVAALDAMYALDKAARVDVDERVKGEVSK